MSSHLAKVHFSLSRYLWCLSDVCVCLCFVGQQLVYCHHSTLGIRPVCVCEVCVRCMCVRCVCEVCM